MISHSHWVTATAMTGGYIGLLIRDIEATSQATSSL